MGTSSTKPHGKIRHTMFSATRISGALQPASNRWWIRMKNIEATIRLRQNMNAVR